MTAGFNARIRMYRQGIGDCLLVQLPRGEGEEPFRMVIDCGVVLGTPDAGELMRRVVDSLQRATGGDPAGGVKGTIDLLVITHEHWDHVSGFVQVEDWQARFDVRRVWAAWTENPADAQARQLDKAKRTALAALAAASRELGLAGTQEASIVNEMLAFFGMGALADPDALGARATTRDARDKALGLAGGAVEFLEPGGPPRRLDGVADARVYVLGPPRDERLLKKADPSSAAPETYGLGEGESILLGAAALDLARDPEDCGPFAASFGIPIGEAEHVDFFRKHYFNAVAPEDDDPLDRMLRDESWRRIDHEWAGAAAELAMKLDQATNNTSLVLAIELKPGGEVLLFPADAQVGNWLSWHEVKFTGDGDGTTVGGLLHRTRFYKVGHHGSHNATLKAKGLEMMDGPGLIAMIPVDQEVARKKRWTEMPLDDLVEALKEQTDGRLLRADDSTFPEKPQGVKKAIWEAFVKTVTVPAADGPERNLYFEVEI